MLITGLCNSVRYFFSSLMRSNSHPYCDLLPAPAGLFASGVCYFEIQLIEHLKSFRFLNPFLSQFTSGFVVVWMSSYENNTHIGTRFLFQVLCLHTEETVLGGLRN